MNASRSSTALKPEREGILAVMQEPATIDRVQGVIRELASTGRVISVGQYALACIGLAALSALSLALFLQIGILPCLLLGALIGSAFPHMVIAEWSSDVSLLSLRCSPRPLI